MKNTLKKYTLVVLGINAAFFLGSCGSAAATNSALLTANKEATAYDYPTRSNDSVGTNYASKIGSITQGQLAKAGVGPAFPSSGNPNLLVIPVELTDYPSVCTEATRTNIYKSFFGSSSDTAWESVASYYAKSSYGNLIINGTVSEWYDSGLSTSQLLTMASAHENDNSGYDPTWDILEGAIKWYEKKYSTNCANFDSDGDGLIDAVWLVYSAPYYTGKNYKSSDYADYMWAYTYADGNAEPSSSGSNRVAYNYSWAAYDFMYSGYGTTKLDSHTYVHETGHLLGLEDYYTYTSSVLDGTVNRAPMAEVDMMDYNIIDHDAFSKFALGWVHPYVVSGSTTITLHPSASTGECVLLPTEGGWNGTPFDEYLLLEYYTPTILNEKDATEAYAGNSVALQGFTENGVRIYHVDARMAEFTGTYSTRTQRYSYTYTYTDKLVSLSSDGGKGTILAHSNTNGMNVLDANDRLIQELDCTEGRNFDVDTDTVNGVDIDCIANDGTLYQDGDSFSYDQYAHSFPEFYYNNKSLMNDGSKMAYSVAFSSMSDESITLSIKKA
jgi:M6 family metalloprotease-like protein